MVSFSGRALHGVRRGDVQRGGARGVRDVSGELAVGFWKLCECSPGYTLNPKPRIPNPKPQTLNPIPYTPNPKPQARNPKPQTPNPKP